MFRQLTRIRHFHTARTLNSDFSHVVIGGGIVGTAIAAELQEQDGNEVLLVDKNEHLGQETTSRNSEVIHAGIYYPPGSLKSQLCIAGKNKIYDAWTKGKFQVPLKKCGKWVVAQDDAEAEYLEKLKKISDEVDVPVSFVGTATAKTKYPLIRAETAVLESPTTGIISAHDYTLFHQARFENSEGTLGLNTELTGIEYNKGSSNYTLVLRSESGEMEVTSDNVVNSAGLYAPEVSNLLLPKERHYQGYFAKGNYFSYQPEKSLGKVTDVLIYPCPNPNASSLGTHLTFDLGGQLRFGPDLEWLDIKKADEIDYTPNPQNLARAYEAIKTYFPGITPDSLHPSYSGVRPKIFSREENMSKFADFVIREEEGYPGFVNLLGIESPGLTASWAIGEYVRDIYHK
ncbi:L-2-hydroxyglutarate dehydrogenase, mitochondrial [Candida viswanathii]|uniref:L-2-hydroxyglutarate dehydrogenase, mitochondrial n=1 Tax=Candida viswanathii TaxID=5486 RepID=A0A367Y6S3_9ASCO|nr:L-2-hydroxyglutarate dehydrogenase, mitochondrial [Candida viswanathii]